ncbi:hypothetical protein F183_A34530 [Bryobacterales bacterium F-183]|nr:hypothetical protein F183_A34530 [Bryobacterales bacterium F-183]
MSLAEKARTLVGQLPESKLEAVVQLLGVMVNDPEGDEPAELTEGDIAAVREGDRRLANGEATVSFDDVVADLGFTMDQILRAGEDALA